MWARQKCASEVSESSLRGEVEKEACGKMGQSRNAVGKKEATVQIKDCEQQGQMPGASGKKTLISPTVCFTI